MKKILSYLVAIVFLIIPVFVNADISIQPKCGAADANGIIKCTVLINDTSAEGNDNLTVTLTEFGGADITNITNAAESNWTVTSKSETNGVWNVILTSPGITGEDNLFAFEYKSSGTADCKVSVGLGDKIVDVKPEETPSNTPTTTPDEKEENKDTGATLPFVALGTLITVAGGAYLATKNKSKMYKI